MYIWKIEKLKEDLINDAVTQRDHFFYYFISMVVFLIAIEMIVRFSTESPNIWDNIYSLSNMLIPLVGTILTFRANGGANGKDFLGRYFSVGFVVTVRFLVWLLPIFIVLAIYYSLFYSEEDVVASTPIDVIPFIIWTFLLYWRIVKHVKDVSSEQKFNENYI